MKRIRLTEREIEAILEVAGDALASETLSCGVTEAEFHQSLAAFESGISKLEEMLRRYGK